MSAAHIWDERILTAVSGGSNTFDRLAETFEVTFSNFTLRLKVYALQDAGLLVDSGRREGHQTVWAVPAVRRRAA